MNHLVLAYFYKKEPEKIYFSRHTILSDTKNELIFEYTYNSLLFDTGTVQVPIKILKSKINGLIEFESVSREKFEKNGKKYTNDKVGIIIPMENHNIPFKNDQNVTRKTNTYNALREEAEIILDNYVDEFNHLIELANDYKKYDFLADFIYLNKEKMELEYTLDDPINGPEAKHIYTIKYKMNRYVSMLKVPIKLDKISEYSASFISQNKTKTSSPSAAIGEILTLDDILTIHDIQQQYSI